MDSDREWTIREKLALATVLCRFGSQYWNFVSKYVVNICKQSSDCRESFYSPKNCAIQYSKLLENEDYIASSKRSHKTAFETCEQRIVKFLTVSRIRELTNKIASDSQKYENLVKMFQIVETCESPVQLAKVSQLMENDFTVEEAFEEIYHISTPIKTVSETTEAPENINDSITAKSSKRLTRQKESLHSSFRKDKSSQVQMSSLEEPTTKTRSNRRVQKINWSHLLDSDGDDQSNTSNVQSSAEKYSNRPKYRSATPRSESSKSLKEPKSDANAEKLLESKGVPNVQDSIFTPTIDIDTKDHQKFENLNNTIPKLGVVHPLNSPSKSVEENMTEPINAVDKVQKPMKLLPKYVELIPTLKVSKKRKLSVDSTLQTVDRAENNQMRKKFKVSSNQSLSAISKSGKTSSSRSETSKALGFMNCKEDKESFSETVSSQTSPTSSEESYKTPLSAGKKKPLKSKFSESDSSGSSVSNKSDSKPKTECSNISTNASSAHSFLFTDPYNVCDQSLLTTNYAFGNLNNFEIDESGMKIWKKSIMLLWKTFVDHRHSSIFIQPVSEEHAPGYSDVIHCPMDLSTIRKNIEHGNLKNIFEFQADVKLMLQNCFMYNSSDSDIYQMALEFAEFISEQMKSFFTTQIAIPIQNSDIKSQRATRTRKKSVP